jgi:hypothetical protein
VRGEWSDDRGAQARAAPHAELRVAGEFTWIGSWRMMPQIKRGGGDERVAA